MAGPALEPGIDLRPMSFMRHNLGPVLATALAAFSYLEPASVAETLRCAKFSREELPAPMPPPYPSALERLKWINQTVKSARYSILFFGDSLTEGWDAKVWERSLAPRGALNAGVAGDRTDHLLWRLQHGNLAGPQPKAVVLLIGTNDLAYGRSPELTADASAPISKRCARVSRRRGYYSLASCRARNRRAPRSGLRWPKSTS